MTELLQTPRPRHKTASVIMLTLDVLCLLFLLYCFTFVPNKFLEIFDELLEGGPLSFLTRFILAIPSAVSVFFFVGAVAALLYKESRVTNKKHTLVVNTIVFVAAIILFMILAIAMFMPLIITIGSFS